ncbi:hypothetical protein XAB3213_30048 [Xanthomonas citri pv. bilvae]|nr:hypothetical protein XAB3213_30048 [Xanthomonas citri pv. bilvae]
MQHHGPATARRSCVTTPAASATPWPRDRCFHPPACPAQAHSTHCAFRGDLMIQTTSPVLCLRSALLVALAAVAGSAAIVHASAVPAVAGVRTSPAAPVFAGFATPSTTQAAPIADVVPVGGIATPVPVTPEMNFARTAPVVAALRAPATTPLAATTPTAPALAIAGAARAAPAAPPANAGPAGPAAPAISPATPVAPTAAAAPARPRVGTHESCGHATANTQSQGDAYVLVHGEGEVMHGTPDDLHTAPLRWRWKTRAVVSRRWEAIPGA